MNPFQLNFQSNYYLKPRRGFLLFNFFLLVYIILQLVFQLHSLLILFFFIKKLIDHAWSCSLITIIFTICGNFINSITVLLANSLLPEYAAWWATQVLTSLFLYKCFKEVRHNCSAHRSAHLFVIALSSHNHVRRKHPKRTFLQCSCPVIMINIIKN